MKELVIDYIINNWFWLIPSILSVVEFFILLVCKKRPKLYGFVASILTAVKQAEIMYVGHGRGAEKLEYVISQVCKLNNMVPDKITRDVVSHYVDKILTSPKKGDYNG